MPALLDRLQSRKQPRIRYRCPSCAKKHTGFPAAAYWLPDVIAELSEAERAARVLTSSDLCSLDGSRYFIRCVLQVPVTACDDGFEYGPWVEVAQSDFCRYVIACWGREPFGVAMSGRIANGFPGDATTLGLSCDVVDSSDSSDRPLVRVTDAGHTLQVEQNSGMTIERAIGLVGQMNGFVMIVD